MNERVYEYSPYHESVGYWEAPYFRFVVYFTSPHPENTRPATTEEIETFERQEKEILERGAELTKREDELLALAGLQREDFSRFRGAYLEDGKLCVYTRENGIGARSVAARQNPNYLSSETDVYDSTYEHYEFRIPGEAE